MLLLKSPLYRVGFFVRTVFQIDMQGRYLPISRNPIQLHLKTQSRFVCKLYARKREEVAMKVATSLFSGAENEYRISIDYQSFPKERLLCTTIRPLSKHSGLQSVARVVPTLQR